MARGAAVGGARPPGTDGSDFRFRMTVDDRYKKAARARTQLRKLLAVQAAFVVVRALWTGLEVINGEQAPTTTMIYCALGACAVFIGTLGLKPSGSYLLNFYLFFNSMCLTFTLIPIVNGHFFSEWSKVWDSSKQGKHYGALTVSSLQGLEQIAGILVLLLATSSALSLLKLTALKKSS